MKRDEDPSPFEEESNNIGLYDRSIVWDFFRSGKKLTFDKIERYF